MTSEHESPDAVGSAEGGELSAWVEAARLLPLPDIPALLSIPDGRVVRATEQAAQLAGETSSAALLGQTLTELTVRDGSVSRLHGPEGALVRTMSWPHEADGRLRVTVLLDVSDLTVPSDRPPSERPNGLLDAERIARVGDSPLQDAQRAARIGTWEWDPATDAMRLSTTLHELTGLAADELAFADYLGLVHPEDRAWVREAWNSLLEHHPIEFEHRLILDGAAVRIFRVHGTVNRQADGAALLVGTAQDVTEQRRSAPTQHNQPTRDDLTGLPNRAAATELLDRLLGRGSPDSVAVLSCDIDNFKRVGNSLGHDAGDELLAALARRLVTGLPDGCTAARLSGGDEFVVVCADIAVAGGLESLVTRVSGLLRTTVPVQGHLVQVSASIGVATPDENGVDGGEDLLRFADTAVIEAKRQGPGQASLADPTLMAAANWQLHLEEQLREALQHDELALHYQPVVTQDGSIIAAEALIRWPHPEHGLISPATFLPAAEQGGMLRDLDRWVLRTALHEAAGWPLPHGRGIRIGVNLAGLVPGDPDFIDLVTDAVTDSGIDWHRITLELVETDLVGLRPQARSAMEQLAERGVRFAIDDFGTGYSSLARLKDLPTQILKLDRQFVSGVDNNAADFAITRAVRNMAHAMGRTCIAEGVETTAQFTLLNNLELDSYQGFLFSPPVPAHELRTLLGKGSLPVK